METGVNERATAFEVTVRHGLRPACAVYSKEEASTLHLKKRDAGAVMQDFIDDIKPAVKANGLRFPAMSAIGVDAPADLDLSLDNVDETKAEGYSPD